jgi:hypothetical protein
MKVIIKHLNYTHNILTLDEVERMFKKKEYIINALFFDFDKDLNIIQSAFNCRLYCNEHKLCSFQYYLTH